MTAWGPGAPGMCAVCPAAQSDVEPTTTLSLGDPYFFEEILRYIWGLLTED